MTLEDETGFVNLVIWQSVWEAYRTLARTAGFLGISGKIQAKGGVVHLVAEHLWLPDMGPAPQAAPQAPTRGLIGQPAGAAARADVPQGEMAARILASASRDFR